ncbi:hypothetical protein PMAYCL1PPCAC_31573, partial [Pristionchus mayeri]
RQEMFIDPGIDLTTKPLIEQMREMALNRFSPLFENESKVDGGYGEFFTIDFSNEFVAHITNQYGSKMMFYGDFDVMSSDGSTEDDVEYRDFFPLLSFPNEIVANVLSLLPSKDRLKARVNKKLMTIEAESKYYIKELAILEDTEDSLREYHSFLPQIMCFADNNPHSYDCIRKIFSNTTIGSLTVILNAMGKIFWEFRSLVKEFKNIRRLTLQFERPIIEELMMDDSCFIDLARSCEGLEFNLLKQISAGALHKVYKSMLDGSMKLRELVCIVFDTSSSIDFLKMIGIQFFDGRFFSNRDIEVFKKAWNGEDFYCIFDGNIEIGFVVPSRRDNNHYYESDSEDDESEGYFLLQLHETRESLDQAKSEQGLIRVRVDPRIRA